MKAIANLFSTLLSRIILHQGHRENEGLSVASGDNQQLLICIPFTQLVMLHSVMIKGPEDEGPKTLKLFADQESMDFSNVDDFPPSYVIDLSADHLKGKPVVLKSAKFQNIQSLTIFSVDNQSGSETTKLQMIVLYGTTMEEHLSQGQSASIHSSSPENNEEQRSSSISSDHPRFHVVFRYMDEFKELRKLGGGGYGRVFECRHLLDNMIYAIKKVPFNDDKRSQRSIREVQVFSRLHHPNVVRYHTAWIEDGAVEFSDGSDGVVGFSDGSSAPDKTLYIQMEYCLGTLHVGEPYCAAMWYQFKQIIQGLDYIHTNNCIHRDITPDNIFRGVDGRIKIGDFGLAVFLHEGEEVYEINENSSFCGKKTYLAPEVKEHNQISKKSDMYSVGLILFEILYPTQTTQEKMKVLEEIKQGRLPSDWNHNQQKTELVEQLLKCDPSTRPSTSQVLSNWFPM